MDEIKSGFGILVDHALVCGSTCTKGESAYLKSKNATW
jgi:hypothetical protein